MIVETDCYGCLNLNRAARRACRVCRGSGYVHKSLPDPPAREPEPSTCDGCGEWFETSVLYPLGDAKWATRMLCAECIGVVRAAGRI